MAMLRLAGHEITFDWTDCTIFDMQQAIHDLRGVVDSDVFVGIFEDDVPYNGALVEFGAALVLGKPCYLIGDAPTVDRCIFAKHPNVRRGYNAFLRDLV
jgi:hypothetical protein